MLNDENINEKQINQQENRKKSYSSFSSVPELSIVVQCSNVPVFQHLPFDCYLLFSSVPSVDQFSMFQYYPSIPAFQCYPIQCVHCSRLSSIRNILVFAFRCSRLSNILVFSSVIYRCPVFSVLSNVPAFHYHPRISVFQCYPSFQS
ncbi:hypothetical protein Glove_19g90 [Diversispora epigaea]|uniref:Uncharacterized protein n=1 Tax=Diversispora epigaea TaxID=1348612 RepID=A0A397JL10_9GLOM|nr:hypothetical protein Glove_19g90 [Diversispora epigaea]